MCVYSCMRVIQRCIYSGVQMFTNRQMAEQFRLLHREIVRVFFFSIYRFIQILFRAVISLLGNLKIMLITHFSFSESNGDSDICQSHAHEVIWHIVQFGVNYSFLFVLKCSYNLRGMSSLQA